MKIKCDYCSNTYEDTLSECPNCGARNPVQKSVYSKDPKTIEELQEWYRARNLPPYGVTRFYIGVDYRNPKAFGIYEDEDGDIVVYKNKADGTRAIRYKGKDEAYAVNELFQKLKDEIVHQKAINNRKSSNSWSGGRGVAFMPFLLMFVAFWLMFASVYIPVAIRNYFVNKNNGYYVYDGKPYYKDGSDWYVYYDDDYYVYSSGDTDYTVSGWTETNKPSEYSSGDIKTDHYYGYDYSALNDWVSDDSEFSDVSESDAWDDNHTSRSYDSGSDYDWDSSDSWDSRGTDWDSDWCYMPMWR